MMFTRRHWLYDVPSSRPRAEALLVVSDLSMLAAPVLLTTAVLHRPGGPVDAVLTLLWLAVARALARCLAWMERPREPFKLYTVSLVFVALTAILITVGWELIYTENSKYVPIGFGTAGVILLAWVSALFLFQPRAYRLYDFLCGAVALLGLVEKKPLAWLWIPLFLVGLLLSSTTRHVLHDVVAGVRKAPINLQNGRVLALGGALLGATVFFALYFSLHRGFDFPAASELGSSPGWRRSQLVARPRAPSSRDRGGGARRAEEPQTSRSGSKPYSYRVDISSVANRPLDTRPALLAIVKEAAGAWPPNKPCLWRGATFSNFVASSSTWEERAPLIEDPRPHDVIVPLGESAAKAPDGVRCEIEYEVLVPVFQSLVGLYRPVRFDVTVDRYRTNASGDIFPKPAIRPGVKYGATSIRVPANLFPTEPMTGVHPERRYLEIPEPAAIGVDLAKRGREIFGARVLSIQDAIKEFEYYLTEKDFRYHRSRGWRGAKGDFQRFLDEEKAGNCSVYATTAALLLRTADVSTRLAVGFLAHAGPERQETEVKISQAHAWVEVYFPKKGWRPLDPTRWLKLHAESPLDPDSSSALAAGTGAGSERSEGAGGRAPDPLAPNVGDRADAGRSADGDPRAWRPNGRSESLVSDSERLGSDPRYSEADYEGWFEFGDYAESRGGRATGRLQTGSAASSYTQDRYEAGSELRFEERGDGTRVEPRTLFGQIVRLVLLVSGCFVSILLLVTYRLARKREEERDEDEDEVDDEEIDLLAAPAATAGRQLERDTPRGVVVSDYQRLQQELALNRAHRRPGQTPREHGDDLGRRIDAVREPFRNVVQILYRALYGDKEITEHDAEEHRRECERIRRRV